MNKPSYDSKREAHELLKVLQANSDLEEDVLVLAISQRLTAAYRAGNRGSIEVEEVYRVTGVDIPDLSSLTRKPTN